MPHDDRDDDAARRLDRLAWVVAFVRGRRAELLETIESADVLVPMPDMRPKHHPKDAPGFPQEPMRIGDTVRHLAARAHLRALDHGLARLGRKVDDLADALRDAAKIPTRQTEPLTDALTRALDRAERMLTAARARCPRNRYPMGEKRHDVWKRAVEEAVDEEQLLAMEAAAALHVVDARVSLLPSSGGDKTVVSLLSSAAVLAAGKVRADPAAAMAAVGNLLGVGVRSVQDRVTDRKKPAQRKPRTSA